MNYIAYSFFAPEFVFWNNFITLSEEYDRMAVEWAFLDCPKPIAIFPDDFFPGFLTCQSDERASKL